MPHSGGEAPTVTILQAQCPAKINLFLHVVGRRHDGYHLLESIFCPIALSDDLELKLHPRQDNSLKFKRTGALLAIPEDKDLTVKACKAFFGLPASQMGQGANTGWDIEIHVKKRIPEQAGLGGGSSNAAQVLRLLDKKFGSGVERRLLLDAALRLGADVPFFMQDNSAFVEGVGEKITPIRGIKASLLIYKPKENCPTGEIFASDQLTRDSSPVKIAVFDSGGFAKNEAELSTCKTNGGSLMWRFLDQQTMNSLQIVVEQKLPSWQASFKEFCQVIQVFKPLLVRMSGSGSSWFAAFEHQEQNKQAHAALVQAGFDKRGLLLESKIESELDR